MWQIRGAKLWLISLSGAVLVGIAVLALLVAFYLHLGNNHSKPILVLIEKGASVQAIAYQLSRNGSINYPLFFRMIVRLSGLSGELQAGEYEFPANATPAQILERLTAGDVYLRRVTIPEGLTSFEVINRVMAAEGLTGTVPNHLPEGSLLPETYYYTYGETRTELLKRMQIAMQKTMATWWPKRHENLPIKTKEQALILASIVEKETGLKKERGRVAAVFINRLHKVMRLQTDPTVIYALTRGKYILDRPLSKRDMKIESPYNTYRVYGLPPTPISNPSVAAIIATLQPLATDELYFVSDGEGGHHFAKSLKEHNRNVQLLRKIERQRRSEKTSSNKDK